MAMTMVEKEINHLIETRLAANGSFVPSEVKEKQ
jgi:hypothetical protein